jgi:hypothetical protein
MKVSKQRIRRRFLFGATAVIAAAMTVTAVTSSAGAQPKSHAGPSEIGPGYPPPGGIYTSFTNCPLYNPLMHESVFVAACVAANTTSGSITIGNIITPVVQPVNVQFGFWAGPDQTYYADVVPPLAGQSAMLVTKPDLIPESLTTMLGCPSSNKVVENLCQQATSFGGKYLDVYALAQSAGAITNFNLLSWTQPVMFKLINPLLGNDCSIGTIGNPVVLNPSLSISSGQLETDPNPTKHPDTQVLATQSTAGDDTFSAPALSGCGPGGVKNIPVEAALDASAGLPAASGVNSLTLTGSFDVGYNYSAEGYTSPLPPDEAKILLSAFKASIGTPPPPTTTTTSAPTSPPAARPISSAELPRVLRRLGVG